MTAAARYRHPDRVGLQPWLLLTTAAAAAACSGAAATSAVARGSVSPTVGLLVGLAVGPLAVVGLPSVSVRLVARMVLVASGGILIRFGTLTGSLIGGSQDILAWLIAAVVLFVLTDRIGTDAQPGIAPTHAAGSPSPRRASGEPAGPGRADPRRTARASVVTTAGVLLLVLLVTPSVVPHLAGSAVTGEGPRLPQAEGGSNVLRSTDSLDMTSRPDLTDEVMFRVTADRPSFWRGETFDQWDGRRWTRSDGERLAVTDGLVVTGPDDLGVTGPDRFTQRFRIETTFSDLVFGASSIVSVDAGRALAQRRDGTVITAGVALGRGATYEVVSRRPVLSEPALRAAEGPVPADVQARYAAPPVISDRVRKAATAVTANAVTTYDKVRALERWMGARTEYSLDAPLSPVGVDVVDHFLFDSRQGWCEQVASSLVVMARANGIPARLVTGFVPDERDRVTGTYVVRARDAHSWTEVWFAGLGWVPFDPTANVPLAATEHTETSWGQWLIDHALVLALLGGAVLTVGWPLLVLVRRWRGRVADRPLTWAAQTDARLVQLGLRAGRARGVGETASAYARVVAERYQDPRLLEVGDAIEDAMFAAEPPDESRRARADRVLEDLAHEPVAAGPQVVA